MTVTVDVINRQDRVPFTGRDEELAREAAHAALAAGGFAGPAELSLCLVDDVTMTGLNRRYRGEDGTTDVLAFPQLEASGPGGPPPHLGDVVISLERALAQGATLEEELVHLVTHGVLHLLGFDHCLPEEERAMQELERAARRRFTGHAGT